GEKNRSEHPSPRFVALVQPISAPTSIAPSTIVIWLHLTNAPSGEVSVTATNDRIGMAVPLEVKFGAPSRINAFASMQVLLRPEGSSCHTPGDRPAVSFLNPPSRFVAAVQPKTDPFAEQSTYVCRSASVLTSTTLTSVRCGIVFKS